MKNRIVSIPAIKNPIEPCPGFRKKELAEFKLDLVGLCGFGCSYCSSNWGNYLRINRKRFADETERQLGERLFPANAPDLMFAWDDVIEKLDHQLTRKRTDWGAGSTLVVSMQTDGFSPWLLQRGITEQALRMVLERTAFRIRIVTKNAIVGSRNWIDFFSRFPGRIVVGLSIGSLDDEWTRRMEIGTSLPSARLSAYRNLQEAGVPTYGMLCPVFPDQLCDDTLERLVDLINPAVIETIWAEPYNDRCNWGHVRSCYGNDSYGYRWMTDVYEARRTDIWSQYVTEFYLRLKRKGSREGWLFKLRFLLYEKGISPADAHAFSGLEGVLLQAKKIDGLSSNPAFAGLAQSLPGPGAEEGE